MTRRTEGIAALVRPALPRPRRAGPGRRRPTAALGAAALIAGLLLASPVTPNAVADTAPPAGQPATVSADALPTVQINGVVWAQVTVGNTVYVTGQFTQARPAGVAVGGAGSVTRNNLLAYDITTGNLITSFNHSLNAQGRSLAVSPDGRRLYVGGYFTSVDGVTHNRVAAFNTATGALDNTFTANLNNNVLAIAASNSTVYLGGTFTTANGSTRNRLASYTAAGALTTWAPTADLGVQAMALVGGSLVVGGNFTTLNGVARLGIGNLDATTGVNGSWPANYRISDSGTSSAINSLVTDGTNVYGTGFSFSRGGNFEGRFSINPTNGAINWMNSCHGDSYGVYPMAGVLYSATHEHDCSDIYAFTQDDANPLAATAHRAAAENILPSGKVARSPIFGLPMYDNFAGQPIADQLNWYPTLTPGTYTGQGQAAWSVTGNGTYLSMGGEFPTVNGTAQQGLVRFALSSVAPDRVGPTTPAAPTVVAQAPGTLRVSWQASSDMDNTRLTYALYRDGGATPIFSTVWDGAFWQRPALGFTDTVTGAHTYRVRVTDPVGNTVLSAASGSVTAGTTAVPSYAAMVRSDGATELWRLNEASGSTVRNWAAQTGSATAGFNDMTLRSGVTLGAAGPIAGQGTAASFNGVTVQTQQTGGPPGAPPRFVTTSESATGSAAHALPLATFSLEAWVKTSSTTGGVIMADSAFSPTPGGRLSPAVDRVLYVGDDGRVSFGAFADNTNRTITGTPAINDGRWHHVTATLGGGTGRLYVDGTQVAAAAMTSTGVMVGIWRLGGDSLTGWTPQPTSGFLAGQIADAAVYPGVLAANRVQAHFAASGGAVNAAPTAAFAAPSCTGLTCSVNGSASADSDGTVAGYSWNWGDGTAAGTGATATHTWATAGTYPVTLTVTDNGGATGTATRQVTVTGPAPANVAPTAAFTAACTDLSCSFTNGSTDSDGTVTASSWTFGDGGTSTQTSPTRTYAAAGSYPVTLTVTDDGGATATTTRTVTVTAPAAGQAFATDTFARTVTGGFGTADVGGAWTTTTAANFSVAAGTGSVALPTAGSTQTAYLGTTSATSADVTTTFALDKVPSGGSSGLYWDVIGRRVGTNQEYDGLVKVSPGGAVSVGLRKLDGSTSATMLTATTATGLTATAGGRINVRMQVSGTSPTTLALKVWAAGTAEPTTWNATVTDASAALQAAGAVGFRAYVSSSLTNAPFRASLTAFGAEPVA